jgi:hypothetical protein
MYYLILSRLTSRTASLLIYRRISALFLEYAYLSYQLIHLTQVFRLVPLLLDSFSTSLVAYSVEKLKINEDKASTFSRLLTAEAVKNFIDTNTSKMMMINVPMLSM